MSERLFSAPASERPVFLVECNLDAEACAALGEDALAGGGEDFSAEQMEELWRSPGPIYVLPDDDSLGGEAPRRWVRDLYPKGLLCPPEYGEGLEDIADLLHKRGKGAAREVVEGLKARAVDALELELREAEENSSGGGQSLTAYRRVKERILPLVARLEEEGERDAALRDVARRLDLGLRPLRGALAGMDGAETSEQQVPEAPEEGEPPVDPGEVEDLIGRPGVLDRYVQDAARIHGVVGERDHLKLLILNVSRL